MSDSESSLSQSEVDEVNYVVRDCLLNEAREAYLIGDHKKAKEANEAASDLTIKILKDQLDWDRNWSGR